MVAITVGAMVPETVAYWEGEINEIVGTEAAVAEKYSGSEIGAPGVCTVTEAVPTVAISPAGTVAVIMEELTKTVESIVPFQRTEELGVKLVPFTVRVKEEVDDIVNEEGKMDKTTGVDTSEMGSNATCAIENGTLVLNVYCDVYDPVLVAEI